ncbi:MAG: PmoA family protein [Verrucomicrobiae bacterium]|nr:PmoA family protein [Verrucomicrobiae bacterium]NNJ85735.1 hypothetical protein [Akkermansiaceae bacterium]
MKKSTALICLLWLTPLTLSAGFEVKNSLGKMEILDNGKVVFGWQSTPIQKPRGGPQFSGSAFIHPLRTPSGFTLTDIQPSDHLHHFGVWWPWKFISVDGQKFNTWEIQKKQGGHAAVSATVTSQSDDEIVLKLVNQCIIKPAETELVPVINEETTLRFARLDKDTYVLDLIVRQTPVAGKDIEIVKYRYSGFSWRSTPDFKKTNSKMLTSGGHNRDNANGQTARWAMVGGDVTINKKPAKATILIMSAAANDGGTPERLRVWNSKMGIAQFINFNPVVKGAQTLKPENTSVSFRRYRVIVADKAISADQAEKYWKAWKK